MARIEGAHLNGQGAGLGDEPRSSMTLWDYRRRVADLYAGVRATGDPRAGWDLWRRQRDHLFSSHPQSPIPIGRRPAFAGLEYFPYRARFRVPATVAAASGARVTLPHSASGGTPARAVGVVRFTIADVEFGLEMYRIEAYGDSLILPFGDASNGVTTYGGGRYLIDTAKGADLGSNDHTIVLDFNFAYHPSCVHDGRWSCPLPPPSNRLEIPIEAGERLGEAP